MTKALPQDLRADIERFIALMLDKGDGDAVRHITKLKRALAENSPVIDAHVKSVAKNALTPGAATFDLTEDERFLIGGLMLRLADWRDGKPGPPKQFPRRMNLRMSDAEDEALDKIAEKTGEDKSEIIRRLIREAASAPQ